MYTYHGVGKRGGRYIQGEPTPLVIPTTPRKGRGTRNTYSYGKGPGTIDAYPLDRMTRTCENITFPYQLLRKQRKPTVSLRDKTRGILSWLECGHSGYRPQGSWGKVTFSQAVILFTGGGGRVSASVHAGIPHNPPGKACPRCMLGDTVNKRAVCILLECNSCFVKCERLYILSRFFKSF